jgi:hypothetical protein
MSEMAAQILAKFETLPPREQHELLAEMLRRSGELPGAQLQDEHLVILADHLFQSLDDEESRGDEPRTR